MEHKITDIEALKEMWTQTYNTEGNPDWSHILPYYAEDVYFRDTVQEIRGLAKFREMTLSFKKYPNAVLYGISRLTLNEEGKIIEQRDYYDLWGDIFDTIPHFGKAYRKFMAKKFG